jgi:hypothetical protein
MTRKSITDPLTEEERSLVVMSRMPLHVNSYSDLDWTLRGRLYALQNEGLIELEGNYYHLTEEGEEWAEKELTLMALKT